MEFTFKPDNLIKARAQIYMQHRKDNDIDFSNMSDADKALIERLVNTSDDLIKAVALSLSDKEVMTAIGYLPYNYLGIDESKLCSILKFRLNEDSCRVLFEQWQESYNNPECNGFIKRLTLEEKSFQKVLADNHITSEIFLQILDAKSIPLSIIENLTGMHFSDGDDFDKKLKHYGIREMSYLDIDCKRALLTFCGKSDYLSCSEDNILDIIRSYNQYMLKRFVTNFMSKMSLWELENYPNVAAYLRSMIGNKISRTFQTFFAGDSDEDIRKYMDWINIYKIDEYFERDDRSQFWKQYRFENVIKYPISNVVVMEFDQYVAVEFLGNSKGNIYICARDVFRDKFYPNLEALDNNSLRAYFKENKDLCVDNRSHMVRWQSHVAGVIARREIAQMLPRNNA